MRTLSSTLLAQQRARVYIPTPEVTVRPRLGAATKLKWTNLYMGAEQQYLHAAATPSNGCIIRARIENVTGTRTLYRQRCPAPCAITRTFEPWTTVEETGYQGVGMAASGPRVIMFWTLPDMKTIRYIESTDNGMTWSAIATLYVTTNAIYHPAVAMKPNGDVCLFYFEWDTIYAVKRVSGTWGSPLAYPSTPDIVSGLAVSYLPHTRSGILWEWNVVVTGRTAFDQRGVWTFEYGTYGGGPTWTDPNPIQVADYTGIDYRSPFLCIDGAIHRLTFCESSTSGKYYERVMMTWQIPEAEDCDDPTPATFYENLWHEPYPFHPGVDYAHIDDLFYGLAIVATPEYAYITGPDCVWQAPTTPPSLPLTERVLSLKQSINPIQVGGSVAVVEFKNNDLMLTPVEGQDINYELAIAPGYRTTEGDEVSAGPSHWITKVRTTSSPSRCTTIITAEGPEYLLKNTAVRWQKTWDLDEATVLEIITWILSRAGIPLYVEGSSVFTQSFKPAFKIPAGTDCLTALRQMLTLSDVLHFRRSTAILQTTLIWDEPETFRCPSFPGTHPLYSAAYDEVPTPVNWTNSWGTSTPWISGDEMVPQVNDQYGRLESFADLNLDNLADAKTRAQDRITQHYQVMPCGQVVIPPHCGLELWDKMSIKDYRAGIDRQWRVLSIDFTYTREVKSSYLMTVGLCPGDEPLFPSEGGHG